MGHPSLRDVRQQVGKHSTTADGLNRKGKTPECIAGPRSTVAEWEEWVGEAWSDRFPVKSSL